MNVLKGFRFHGLYVACLLSVVLLGCGVNKPLVMVDSGYKIKPAKVAVIAGTSDQADRVFADMLTNELKEKTSLSVLSQKTIAKRIPKYPVEINFRKEASDKPEWFDLAEVKKLKKIQKKLKVDYLFVAWIRNMGVQHITYSRGGGKTVYYLNVFGNMLEYPGGKTVTYSHMYREAKPSLLRMTLFKKESYFIETMLKDAADSITQQVIANTGPGRQAKK